MTTVALIGPDGAGKTTVCRRLEHALPVPAKYIYMGINPDAGNYMLPTTRLLRRVKRFLGLATSQGGPRDPTQPGVRPRGGVKGVLHRVKSGLSLGNRIAEEWYRQSRAWLYQRRGYVVLFDRHYFSDFYDYDVMTSAQPRSLSRRVHGFMLRRLYPRPDLVLLLDAPADVLYARKREGSVGLLEERRRSYMRMAALVPACHVLDATRPIDEVTRAAADVILRCHRQRRAPIGEAVDGHRA